MFVKLKHMNETLNWADVTLETKPLSRGPISPEILRILESSLKVVRVTTTSLPLFSMSDLQTAEVPPHNQTQIRA